MEERQSIATSGSGLSSYYIQHRNASGSASGGLVGMQGDQPGRPHHLDGPPSIFVLPPSHVGGASGGSMLQMDFSSPDSQNSHNAGIQEGIVRDGTVKRKRGRPRKYRPEGDAPLDLAHSPKRGQHHGLASGDGSGLGLGSVPGTQSEKRRGRPPGSGKIQRLNLLGGWIAESAGTGFTPHVITVPSGEDIAARIMSFSQQGPRAVCILSGSGVVSTVTLQSANSGGVITYEGHFEILSLSGSYMVSSDNGSRTRSGGLSISICGPDGRVTGGSIGGVVTACGSVQVIAGSFMYTGPKAKGGETKAAEGSEFGSELNGGDQAIGGGTATEQDLVSSPTSGSWPGLKFFDARSFIDINSTRE